MYTILGLSVHVFKYFQINRLFSATHSQSEEDEFIEGVVCKDTDINDNEMKTFELGDAGRVLLVRQKGKLSALGTKCTHSGAPLVNGSLGEGRIRCQWHGACFNILNGDIEDFPGKVHVKLLFPSMNDWRRLNYYVMFPGNWLSLEKIIVTPHIYVFMSQVFLVYCDSLLCKILIKFDRLRLVCCVYCYQIIHQQFLAL